MTFDKGVYKGSSEFLANSCPSTSCEICGFIDDKRVADLQYNCVLGSFQSV